MASSTIADTFRRHAVDCERMAKTSSSSASRTEWRQLAERARRCAALYDDARSHERTKERRRRRGKAWSPILARDSTM